MDEHRLQCADCAEFERTACLSLNMLRGAALLPESAQGFDERLMRRLRVDNARASFRYWSPALVGALIACFALFAALQMITQPTRLKGVTIPGGEARMSRAHAYPSLELVHTPSIQ